MINIFIFHRDLRINDNTTLINILKHEHSVIPIFIFTPEQININKNKYFSNNAVQFMIESLHELSNDIKKKQGVIYFFKGDNIQVLKAINKKVKIKSIGWNIDYTPYALKRDNDIKLWAKKNNINIYENEDYLLYDLLDGKTLKKNNTPYQVFTPFKNHCIKNLKVRDVDNFNDYKFLKSTNIINNKFYIHEKSIDDFYHINYDINVSGGRINALKILNNLNKFNNYQKDRDFFTYNTTFLGAHNHFSTVSIREVFHNIHSQLGINSGLINELHFRDFYYQLSYYNNHMLQGQIEGSNKLFRDKYNFIKWNDDNSLFEKWSTGTTGIPVCDAGMRQLNKTGFMHNRLRMITACIATKLFLLPWTICEKYFATKLVDYDPIQNSCGWNWTIGGIDPQQYTRIFSPQSQSLKFDKDTIFIKKWIPELIDVPSIDIHNWEDKYIEYPNIYIPPIIEYKQTRKNSIKELLRVNKIKN
jgi:deoxyribodipyrimidine photo-lyase